MEKLVKANTIDAIIKKNNINKNLFICACVCLQMLCVCLRRKFLSLLCPYLMVVPYLACCLVFFEDLDVGFVWLADKPMLKWIKSKRTRLGAK